MTRKFFIAPHNDDETLFGAFTLLREKPELVVVFDGHVQAERGRKVTAVERRIETRKASQILGLDGIDDVHFMGFDDRTIPSGIDTALSNFNGAELWIPAVEEGGHHHHNLVGSICQRLYPNATRYLTYTNKGKSTDGVLVRPEPEWIPLKLRALACYESQFRIPDCQPHFLRSQEEYYAR